ncbi:MAG: hypothetical protein KY397_06825 [Gemmatimonadetes bacterium]|nr:hypothetical protein [Gemmatimonadota bacterium]
MRTLVPALAALLLLGACGSDVDPPEPTGTSLRPDSFRRVLVELTVARLEALPDTQAWEERRGEILERYGVTAGDLRAFVEAWGRNDEVMEGIYRSVGAAIDSVANARSPGEGAEPFPGVRTGEPVPADSL